ncbi:MAG: hypothetical protein ACYTF1_03795 [Planctomycetota bacterium]|jgi:hypothetical protein
MANLRTAIMLVCSLVGPLAVGCSAPDKPAGPTVTRVTSATPEQYQLLWDATANTLRQYNFRLDRQDRLAGILTTHPDTTGNWFEWWRYQPKSTYHWMEANLHTIQRQAKVRIKPADQAGDYNLNVQIDRYRYSLEERQIDNAAAALRLYSSEAPTYSGQTLKPSESAYWIHQGRDPQMENAVLSSILSRYGPNLAAEEP